MVEKYLLPLVLLFTGFHAQAKTPCHAANTELSLYLPQNTTGKLRLAAPCFYQVPVSPLSSRLITPSNRGLLIDKEHNQIEVAAKLVTDAAKYYLNIKLVNSANQVLESKICQPGEVSCKVIFQAGNLAAGTYKVIVLAFDQKTNKVKGQNEYVLKKTGNLKLKHVDKYGGLLIDYMPIHEQYSLLFLPPKENISEISIP